MVHDGCNRLRVGASLAGRCHAPGGDVQEIRRWWGVRVAEAAADPLKDAPRPWHGGLVFADRSPRRGRPAAEGPPYDLGKMIGDVRARADLVEPDNLRSSGRRDRAISARRTKASHGTFGYRRL